MTAAPAAGEVATAAAVAATAQTLRNWFISGVFQIANTSPARQAVGRQASGVFGRRIPAGRSVIRIVCAIPARALQHLSRIIIVSIGRPTNKHQSIERYSAAPAVDQLQPAATG